MSESRNEVYIDLIAGWASGAISIFCSQPIDTVLTRIQARPTNNVIINKTGCAVSTAKSLVESQGMLALWRGSSPMIGAIPFQNPLMMAGYGYGKRWCEKHEPDDVLLGVFIGGCTGGVAQSFLMSPVEIAWRGLGATLLRDGLPHGVWFASYQYSKDYLSQIDDGTYPGAFAAFTAWAVGYPFDVIKTRIQAAKELNESKSVAQATREILAESNGRPLAALYRGFWLKIAKAVPASAVNFYVYESVVESLRVIGD
eukprot:15327647-Ditylum_brightwellii.AAC.1